LVIPVRSIDIAVRSADIHESPIFDRRENVDVNTKTAVQLSFRTPIKSARAAAAPTYAHQPGIAGHNLYWREATTRSSDEALAFCDREIASLALASSVRGRRRRPLS
jgi:hypothetical protein